MSAHPVLPRMMTLDEFTPLVGHWFDADCAPRTARLLLLSATPIPSHDQDHRPPFRLLFRTDPAVLLVTGSYLVRCGTFGPDIIHIAPTAAPRGPGPGGPHYQAVFN